jgi:hypothetical protein
MIRAWVGLEYNRGARTSARGVWRRKRRRRDKCVHKGIGDGMGRETVFSITKGTVALYNVTRLSPCAATKPLI